MAGFESILSGIAGGLDSTMNLIQGGLNIANYFRQGELQQKAWDREDTAVQRRSRDLAAAGINPVLAAGGGAAASSPIALTAPDVRQDNSAVADMVMRVMSAKQNISQSIVETKLKEKMVRNADLEALNLSQELKNRVTDQQYKMQQLQTDRYNLDWYRENKLPTNSSGIAKDIAQLVDMISKQISGGEYKGITGSLADAFKGLLAGDSKKSPDAQPFRFPWEKNPAAGGRSKVR